MDHAQHAHPHGHSSPPASRESLNGIAFAATLHCLLGCAIGEVAGLVVGTALGWGDAATIALAVALAFISGFALTALPFLRRGYALKAALRIALAVAGVAAFPVNRWLIARGRGHALAHAQH